MSTRSFPNILYYYTICSENNYFQNNAVQNKDCNSYSNKDIFDLFLSYIHTPCSSSKVSRFDNGYGHSKLVHFQTKGIRKSLSCKLCHCISSIECFSNSTFDRSYVDYPT